MDFDNTENLYIEGDNLDVLKLLREDYLGKIKMIYIDPPYNTGNDFVYEDDFAQSADDYIESSGQKDDVGNHLVANTENNGRFHTDWLNMIYPRLKVAKDFLSDDGVIFISIDDNEQKNLKNVCDEIFGDSNFVALFVWKSRQNKDNRNTSGVSIDHEYILCYSKTPNTRVFEGSERKLDQYQNPDNDPRGPWTSANMAGLLSEDLRPNCHYDLIDPKTGINYGKPKMGWRYDQKTMSKLIQENRILWPNSPSGRPRKKSFLSEISEVKPGFSSLIGEGVYTRTATKEVENLMGDRCFDFPKPVELITSLLEQTSYQDSIILDFFSGSGTTAEALMRLNKKDNGHRKYILIQLPEKTDEKSIAYKQGYKNICDIGKERIRRAGKKILEERGTDQTNSSVQVDKLDVGFRVLKLDSSNMKDVYYKPSDITNDLFVKTEDNIKEDRTDEDLLFQVMLEMSVPLSAKIRSEEICGKNVIIVDDDYLIACFDKDITDDVVTDIAKRKPQYFVMRDSSAVDDSVITNFETIFQTYSKDTVRKIL